MDPLPASVTDALSYEPLDDGIWDVVTGLRERGVETTYSCDGTHLTGVPTHFGPENDFAFVTLTEAPGESEEDLRLRAASAIEDMGLSHIAEVVPPRSSRRPAVVIKDKEWLINASLVKANSRGEDFRMTICHEGKSGPPPKPPSPMDGVTVEEVDEMVARFERAVNQALHHML